MVFRLLFAELSQWRSASSAGCAVPAIELPLVVASGDLSLLCLLCRPEAFDLPLDVLESRYKELQKKLHPDLHAHREQVRGTLQKVQLACACFEVETQGARVRVKS